MSATEVSPSQSIEASLLNRHASVSSHASFTDQDPNTYISPVPPNAMSDTTHPEAMDHQPSPQPSSAEQPHANTIATDIQDHDRMAMEVDNLPPNQTANTEPSPPSLDDHHSTEPPTGDNAAVNSPSSTEPQVLVAVHATTSEASPTENAAAPGQPEHQTSEAAREGSTGTRTEEEDNDDEPEDENDESSSDEEEYWGGHRDFVARLKEDTSTPTEAELKELERSAERSALDNSNFESSVHTALEDPEYVPVETGKVTWVLDGFHGTKEAPNKQRVMRSPSVTIGGYQWNIKVYPHGNDGTDYVSVYVECTGPKSSVEPAVVCPDDSSMQGVPLDPSSSAPAENKETGSSETTDAPNTSVDTSWEVPAQVGCVMYNPDEPRVYAFERANYQFHDASPDCGWVRFYGPWTSLHVRRHLQRQPMLRNDRLAFTAYIRVINDPTRALWFRYGDDGIWDSVSKTGLRGFSAGDSTGNSVITALAPWFHLQPFRNLILDTHTPHMAIEPRTPVKPLLQALKDAMYRRYAPENHSPGFPESLSNIRKTLQLYGLTVRQSTDTMEVWETIRNALNTEYWDNSSDENKPDILSFIKTIKQHVRPQLPSETQESQKEPRSVQEIVNHASEDYQNSYKDWDGYGAPPQTFPAVLQIELCRQRYDASTRKWRRLTHHIKMEDTIDVGNRKYSLFAMVISKGELGSGRVYPIVRAAGPTSQWTRYKAGNATYLTRRQAVESHEGKGLTREGTESVAHLVLYVRSDVIDSVLPPPKLIPASKVMFPLEKPPPARSDQDPLKVVIHDASSFEDYSGLTIVDAWSTDSETFELELNPDSNLIDVQKKLLEIHKGAERIDQFRLWSIAPQSIPVPQPHDLYLVDTSPLTPISDLTIFFGGVRLWLAVIPIEKINPDGSFRIIRTELPPSPPTPTVAPPPNPQEAPPAPLQFVPPPEPPVGPVPGEDMDVPPPPLSPPLAQTESQSEDIVMGGTQDQASNADTISAAQDGSETQVQETALAESQTLEPPPPPQPTIIEEKIPEWQLRDQTYLLFKAFDPQSQQSIGLGSGFFPRDQRLIDIAKEYGVSYESMKLCREYSQGASAHFFPEDTIRDAALSNGQIVVVVRNDISENDKEIIRARGDVLDFGEWYSRLYDSNHFSRQAEFQSGCYFGGKYVHAPLYKGKYLGESVIINTTGDAYKGNCLDGEYHGDGVMYYANGNTYTGEWINGQPEGQGTMVYNQTGNKYVGGWKAGRKHGKGVMTYEVADEEMQLCKICYESEMDALFFRCGHVAACESCARQVSECPVCRRAVEHVVRIWRTV